MNSAGSSMCPAMTATAAPPGSADSAARTAAAGLSPAAGPAAAGSGVAGDGGEPGPGDLVISGGEPGHVQARLGDDRAGESAGAFAGRGCGVR